MNRTLERFGPALVALAALAVYANSIANGFALDDIFIVQTNSRVHDLTDLRSIWLLPYWPEYGAELGLWRPLAIFGYAVQWAITPEPWLFHTVNVLMHAGASVLVYMLLARLTASTAGALVGGMLFAVHPVHTEAVANVVGQAELIAALTTLGACLVHTGRPDGVHAGWGRRIAITMLFLAGVLAKESAIVLPGLLVALDFAQRRVRLERTSLRTYLRAMAMPLFLIAAATVLYFAYRIDVLGSIGGVDAAPALTFLKEENRVLVAFRAWLEYVRLLVFPLELSSDYSPGVILPVDGWSPMVITGAVTFFATAALAVLTPWFPKHGLPAAWLLISALPTSNLFMPIGVVVAERLLYTPSFCMSLIAAWLTSALARAGVPVPRRRPAAGFAALVLLLFGVRTVVRNPDWDSTPSILDALARDYPESYRVHWRSGTRLLSMGQPEMAEQYFRLAHRIWPRDPALLADLADLALRRMEYDSAVALLEESRSYSAWMPQTLLQLAHAYVGAERYDDAIGTALEAASLGATPEFAFAGLAQAWEGTGDLDRAISAWRAAFHRQGKGMPPGAYWHYRTRYARVLARAGMASHALAALDSARTGVAAGDSLSLADIDTLRATIERGCYSDTTPASACPDPVGAWGVLTPVFVNRKNASRSQNARLPAPDASPADTG